MPARDWRTRDRGGRHGTPAQSVGGVVRRIQRTLRWAVLAESGLIGLAAAALTLALVARAGGDLARRDAWVLAFLMALLAALTWLREHHQSASQVARKLDARMRHQGALVTAYEWEAHSTPSAMSQLLVRRVLARLRLREALRAMYPPLVLPIAAPLFALGFLGMSLERTPEQVRPSADLGELTEGMLGELAGLGEAALGAGEAGEIKNDTLRDVLALANRAEFLERRSDLLSEDPVAGQAELAQLAEDMAEMAARVQGQSGLREPLERASSWIDAARMELAAKARAAGADRALNPGTGAPGTVTPGSEKGMMSPSGAPGVGAGSSDAEQAASAGGQANSPAPPLESNSGAFATAYWPPEYDGVVTGWIELQRGQEEEN